MGRARPTPTQSDGIVRAQMFMLEDSHHNPVGTWINNVTGGSTLTLFNGRPGDDAAVELSVETTDVPKLTFDDKQNTIRATLGVNGDGDPWLGFYGSRGLPEVNLETTADSGRASLAFFDQNGKARSYQRRAEHRSHGRKGERTGGAGCGRHLDQERGADHLPRIVAPAVRPEGQSDLDGSAIGRAGRPPNSAHDCGR